MSGPLATAAGLGTSCWWQESSPWRGYGSAGTFVVTVIIWARRAIPRRHAAPSRWPVESAVLWARHSATQDASWPLLAGTDPRQVPIDPNGNLTSRTEGTDTWTYSWNAENQLTKVEKNGAEQARFSYDPIGRRVEKVAGGAATSYVYDDDNILRQTRAASTLKYVQGEEVDEPLAMDDGVAMTYLHVDGLGSVVKVTDATGGVVLTRQYDAWGSLLSAAEQAGYAFTGREWDPEIGFSYHRARYYAPAIGRFINEDPIGLQSDDINLYAYVGGNPVNFIDPLGLYCMYSQSTGRMTCYPWSTAGPPRSPNACQCSNSQFGSSPFYNEQGYSGTGAGRNNPAFQDTPGLGPIPRGGWKYVGKPYKHPRTGRNTMRLTPLPDNECRRPRDCSSFRMHGNNRQNDASHGCIILPPNRIQIPSGEVVFVVE